LFTIVGLVKSDKKKTFYSYSLMSHSCICCKHFTDEDIVSHPTKWVLKNGAVPSQFDWSNKQNRKWQLLRVVPNAAVAVQPTVV